MKVILFDIDGTLLTCGGAGRVAVSRVFEQRFCDATAVDFTYGGMTDRGIMRRGLEALEIAITESLIDDLIQHYLEELEVELHQSEKFSVFSAAVELSQTLRNLGFAVGLGTGNVETGARLKLRHGGIHGFEFGGFGSDHEDRATLIAHGIRRGRERLGDPSADAVIIGDTPLDIVAARAAGARCIAVSTGKFTPQELHPHQPDLLVSSLDDPAVRTFLRV